MNYALSKENLMLLAIGFVIIVVGFCCMIGGGSVDGVTFNPEIFSTRRIVVGPMITLFGFLFEIFAILYRPKKNAGDVSMVKDEEKPMLDASKSEMRRLKSDDFKSIKA
ncbi:MAG: DUF3098 domain-containing protein [Paludibacteraceae bacterium]|nr:DUF3098 domain-containing protein [Paludibacteraceae bacterium]MEE3484948.1 DUF3098 domain-containing protein [Bacteroidales bacterium]